VRLLKSRTHGESGSHEQSHPSPDERRQLKSRHGKLEEFKRQKDEQQLTNSQAANSTSVCAQIEDERSVSLFAGWNTISWLSGCAECRA
jgi:hypothetical protein